MGQLAIAHALDGFSRAEGDRIGLRTIAEPIPVTSLRRSRTAAAAQPR